MFLATVYEGLDMCNIRLLQIRDWAFAALQASPESRILIRLPYTTDNTGIVRRISLMGSGKKRSLHWLSQRRISLSCPKYRSA